MGDDPESDNARRAQPSDDGRQDRAGNPLGAIVDPLTKLSIDTARDITAAVQSTRAAGRDLWKLANVFSRLPARETSEATPNDDEEPSVAADPAVSDSPGIFGGLRRVAETALNPGAVIGAAVAPVRHAIGGPEKSATKKHERRDTDADLRRYGDDLLAKSQQPVDKPNRRHPAFEQILKELAPDEVRMLRFLAVAGIQPSIDIRTKTMFQVGSERLASGVNMIAEMAGCRWPEADQSYLANLNRLGLVRFSSEPVADYRRYALLEVQPRAMEVTEHAASTISVYRSIFLSTFGEQFCDVCIDTDGYNAGGWATNERGDKIIGKGPPDPAAHPSRNMP